MRLFFYLLLFFFLSNCTTVEVTKEIIKASNTVQKSISSIAIDEDTDQKKENTQEEVSIESIEKEKEIINIEQSEEKNILENQQKIVDINFIDNQINAIKELLGKSDLSRKDGNTYLLRYDSVGCRLFLFFDINEKNKKVKHFELRDIKGELIESKQSIEQCYREFKLIN